MLHKEDFGEGKNIEFKREIPKRHENFLKDVIAFSNSTGGKIFIGIEDKTNEVIGIGEKNPFKLADDISNMIFDSCTPIIDPEITVQTLEGKTQIINKMTIEKLEDLGLLCRIGKELQPTHAFRLMTKNKIRYAQIQCALFKGTERDIFIDKREFDGPLYSQLENAYQFVLKHINLSAKIEGLHRKESYELPVRTIRELIINAVVHRSYLDESCIFGRKEIKQGLGYKDSKAGFLIQIMQEFELIKTVKGRGKGKYRFAI